MLKNKTTVTKLMNIVLWFTGFPKIYQSKKLTNCYIDRMGINNSFPYKTPRLLTKGWLREMVEGVECFIKLGTSGDTILFLHGGGYFVRPNIFHFRTLERIQKITGSTIIFPLYPLAPHSDFLEAYDKVVNIYKFILTQFKQHRITVMGDSAGGGFSLGLSMFLNKAGIRQPDKLVLISPWLDITMENPQMKAIEKRDRMLGIVGLIEVGKRWANGFDTKDYRLSPIYGDLSKVGPLMIVTGTNDILNADANKLKNKLELLGKEVIFIEREKLFHDYLMAAPLKIAKIDAKKIGEFILQK